MLGLEIARARRRRRWTLQELADRVGISVSTLRAVEQGTPTVAIGIVFELATLLGVRLYDAEPSELPALVALGRDRLALLPARVRETTVDVDDDF
ncbi:helix-turn-helix domain-containing protein [Mumia sp. Pv 4-285]|uniref:helix-turn-helix domain-containing protein n=1 Tax=Mumia qirimensis TaxID=3234852 RepID=UPI00351CEA41